MRSGSCIACRYCDFRLKKAFDVYYCGQEAERKFALNLLGLYQNIRRAVSLHENLSHDIERPAELTVGRFGGIDVRAFICHLFCFFLPFLTVLVLI